VSAAPAPRRMTIRFRLALAVALALSPVLLLGAVQSWAEFRRDSVAQTTSLSLAALRSAAGARARVQSAAALLETLNPQTIGLLCAPRLAGLVQGVPGYQNIVRFDRNGRVQCSAGTVKADPDRRNADWFLRLKNGAAIAVENAPPGVYGDRPALLAGVRTTDANGEFSGAMVSIIDLASLRPDTTDPSLPKGTEVALADAQGRYLMRTDPKAFAAPPAGFSTSALRPDGFLYMARAPSGDDRMHAAAPLIGRTMFVILSAPRPGLWFWTQVNPLQGLLLPLLAWAAAWLAVAIVADRVVIRWLAYLDRIAGLYAKGRFSVRPIQAENAPEEIRALAQTLDTMADAIVARDHTLREQMAHKDALMREIHHRVKNNLQVITSLLNMQQRALTDPAARAAMSDTRQRITALALIYRALYQSPDLRRVDVRQFLEELTAQLTVGESGQPGRVRTLLEADDLEIDPDKLAPLALFAVEAITNARKHAFGEEGGLITVRFTVNADEVVLEISDDGRGDGGALENSAAGGVGRTLMTAFARQLRGRAEMVSGPTGGVTVRLIFPAPGAAAPPLEPEAPSGNQAAA
jgi:two-component sensor histidine kinase